MSLRRTVLACAVTFVCALAVFTLPRFAWNTAQAALGQQPVAADSVSRTPAPSAPTRSPQAAPRSLGQRLTGVFGIALILGRSEEHTSELQSRSDLVCRLLLEKTAVSAT